jgi:hypothetical protein
VKQEIQQAFPGTEVEKQPAALEKFLTTHENLPAGDYVSPTLKTVVNVDSCFPNKILGNINNIQNPFFRKSITHNWYVDKNFPECGFLTRDEAHILLHCALLYQGKNALEIGSHTGWSTIHLALAGTFVHNIYFEQIVTSCSKCCPHIKQ